MTRQDYIDKKVTHEEYYTHVAKLAGIKITSEPFLKEVRAALDSGDRWLNTIPLHRWDQLAAGRKLSIVRALKECGDFWSMAGGVCVMKQAAINAAKEL